MRELESFDEGAEARREFERAECKNALSRSKLPGLDHALNPYVGCAHDCVYCYAPYVLGIERSQWWRAKVKSDIPRLLAKELSRPKGTIGVGTVTDPYQPLEKETGVTRRCLEVMAAKRARFSILTKSDLVLRDLDVIKRAEGAEVGLTITTLDDRAAGRIERNAPPPKRRLEAVRRLVSEGIDAYVLIGPVLPSVTERELESFIEAIAGTGVRRVMTDRLRLRPGMLADLSEAIEAEPGAKGFDYLASSTEYLEGLVRDVESCARRFGLRVEGAF